MRYSIKYLIVPITGVLFILALISACITDKNVLSGVDYDLLIQAGWDDYEAQNYSSALQKFIKAIQFNPVLAQAYTGSGWSYLKLDKPAEADTSFLNGSLKFDADAHLFAGWAFTLNALKDHEKSNVQIEITFSLDSSWQFPHQPDLDYMDLHIVRAENYLLLGNFNLCLIEVQIINPDFVADIRTIEGQAALAEEIERLRFQYG